MARLKRVSSIETPDSAPQYELRVRRRGPVDAEYEIWQLPAPASPHVTCAVRVAGLRGRNLELIEHRVLRRLSQAGVKLGPNIGAMKQGHALTEDLALVLGLLFRTLAPMRSRENMRSVSGGHRGNGPRRGSLLAGNGHAPQVPATCADRAADTADRARRGRTAVMKLQRVEIQNYRAIRKFDLQLDSRLVVFHGDNAHGKTSVLSAIATGLGGIPMLLPDVSGVGFRKTDGRGLRHVRVGLTTVDGVTWDRRVRGPRRRYAGRSLKETVDAIVHADREETGPVDLPIVAFYDTDRAVFDQPQRRRGFKTEFPRYAALEGALSARTDFRDFFKWFYAKENEELREQRERLDFNHRLNELEAVRRAIAAMIPGVSKPRIKLGPLRFVVSVELEGANRRNCRLTS